MKTIRVYADTSVFGGVYDDEFQQPSRIFFEKFDCVQMKHLGAAKVREQTATLTKEQELAFWRERSDHLRQLQEALKAHSSQALA